eukprot:CAMPEP_0185592784 /NCGR_PEP_ID=MMETSP0434-20130131/69156_1 /TAXON_ID=626734 ORGANISM="Favella taraikaensis, Strain Fe Narragansett Bay" /NCGR_SAMPLE_ID=MMETSP0434 /ASSEMBLY_ACC=CAM_ASM_000379 /LENGTH=57 /DNA_ID=CAMNT_0028218857 /DNA_START=91 /DNA_END=261 /DNA_ORIENTATION=-
MEWNQHNAYKHALKSVFLVQPSIRSWVKLAHPLKMLDLMSLGASLATLTEPCIKDSG